MDRRTFLAAATAAALLSACGRPVPSMVGLRVGPGVRRLFARPDAVGAIGEDYLRQRPDLVASALIEPLTGTALSVALDGDEVVVDVDDPDSFVASLRDSVDDVEHRLVRVGGWLLTERQAALAALVHLAA